MRKVVLLAALAAILLHGCDGGGAKETAAEQQKQSDERWPAESDPASQVVYTSKTVEGTTLVCNLTGAAMNRAGRLVRFASLSFVPRQGLMPYCYGGIDELPLSVDWEIGCDAGGNGGYASPREGLTWGEVAAADDIVLDVRQSGG